MHFISLTQTRRENEVDVVSPILINLDRVEAIFPTPSGTGTVIHFLEGETSVREDYPTVLDLIKLSGMADANPLPSLA